MSTFQSLTTCQLRPNSGKGGRGHPRFLGARKWVAPSASAPSALPLSVRYRAREAGGRRDKILVEPRGVTMSTQTLTLQLPDRLYARLQQRAQQSNRTLEAELLEVLSTAVPADESLPHPLAEEVLRMDDLDDAALWQAARSRLSAEKSTQLELLHFKRQREGLSETEACTLSELVQQYERSMLIRARAAAILKLRGHDLSGLAATS